MAKYKLRFADGTTLALDRAGLQTWVDRGKVDPDTAVQPPGAKTWSSLQEFLAGEGSSGGRRSRASGPPPEPTSLKLAPIDDDGPDPDAEMYEGEVGESPFSDRLALGEAPAGDARAAGRPRLRRGLVAGLAAVGHRKRREAVHRDRQQGAPRASQSAEPGSGARAPREGAARRRRRATAASRFGHDPAGDGQQHGRRRSSRSRSSAAARTRCGARCPCSLPPTRRRSAT